MASTDCEKREMNDSVGVSHVQECNYNRLTRVDKIRAGIPSPSDVELSTPQMIRLMITRGRKLVGEEWSGLGYAVIGTGATCI